MKKSTGELLDILRNTTNIDSFIENEKENFVAEDLTSSLEKLLTEKNITKSECIKESGLDRTYAYQIFSGTKKPSRDKLLTLCFAMKLTEEEVQTLLKHSGYTPLYARVPRDGIIIWALNNQFTLDDVNGLLFDRDFELLQ